MSESPTHLRSLREERVLEIHWRDGTIHHMPYKFLRGRCPCAACVNEFTGERILDIDSVADDIRPTNIGFSGNYALKILWSDGHHTGLYTWDYLAQLAREEEVTTR